MFIIVLNSSNLNFNGANNSYTYKFPNSINLTDKYIAVSQITMYYSWFNITSVYRNNFLSYSWTVGGVSTTYQINIPDGLYNIVDINSYCQWVMINNGHYLINSAGSNVYYFELLVNASRYAIQINTFQVPTSLPSGYTQPGNFAGYPTQTFNPIITIPAAFNNIIGYPSNFASNNNINNAYVPPTASKSNNYVSKNSLGTLSYLSNTAPNVQPNSTIFLSISNINNPYAQPSSIIYAISPTVSIGEQIIERPPNFMWNKLMNGYQNEIVIQFYGIDNSPVVLNDTNLTIMLTIRDKDESFLGTK